MRARMRGPGPGLGSWSGNPRLATLGWAAAGVHGRIIPLGDMGGNYDAIYATLGVFLFIAARDPYRHLSLISFAIWSSIVHGAVMAVQSILNPLHTGHLYGDVSALFVVAVVLAFLSPEAFRLPFARRAA